MEVSFEISTYIMYLKDIWGMEDLFGAEAREDPAEGFRVRIDDASPEQIRISFDRDEDERDLMIEQQGHEIMLYLYPNSAEVEKRILLARDGVVIDPSKYHHSIDKKE